MMASPIIFVHGAWHASWCWQKIASALLQQGRAVLTPDLPGHGLAWQPPHTITLDHYVTSMIELIQKQSEPVTLVGHSMGGIIISEVAEKIPDRICELVFVTAYIPKNNESFLSITSRSKSRHILPHLTMNRTKQEAQLKASFALIPLFFNCCTAEDAHYAISQLQSQPMGPWTDTVNLGKHFESIPKRVFIAKYDRAILPNEQMVMGKAVTEEIHYLDADHAAYYSAAGELARLL